MKPKQQDLKHALIEMATSEQFVPGICNYCDRWCVRCPKSRKCLSYAYGLTIKGLHPKSTLDDQKNHSFWKSLKEYGKAGSIKLIDKTMKLPFTSEENLDIRSENYEKHAIQWLKEVKASSKLSEEIQNRSPINKETCLEVIEWYSKLIRTKTERALKELNIRTDRDFTLRRNPYRDNIGSAKLLLIACQRSHYAFGVMFQSLGFAPEKMDLQLVRKLIAFEEGLKVIFPNAMEFVRPGQDD